MIAPTGDVSENSFIILEYKKKTTKTFVMLQMSFKVFIVESAIAKHKNNIHVGISMCVSSSVANFSEVRTFRTCRKFLSTATQVYR